MNILNITLKNGKLNKHYQQGMQRLLELPIKYAKEYNGNEFFAYISTLGGGLVDKDEYFQSFDLIDTNATLNSQSNQKIYKGYSKLNTKINIDTNSSLIFHNDANIFYKNSNFKSKSIIFAEKNSKIFYLDGGFLGYSEGEFNANMICRLYIDSKLSLNDNFNYKHINNVNLFYKYQYFYTIIIRGIKEIATINEKDIISYTSSLNDNVIVRILANDNDRAMEYINDLKNHFLKGVNMA